jgi:hypothetical protein
MARETTENYVDRVLQVQPIAPISKGTVLPGEFTDMQSNISPAGVSVKKDRSPAGVSVKKKLFAPNLAYLENPDLVRVATTSEKERLLEAVGSSSKYGTFDLAFMHTEHPVVLAGTLAPGSLATVEPCDCFDNYSKLLPENHPHAVHMHRLLTQPYCVEFVAGAIPSGAASCIDEDTLAALHERAMVTLTPEQSGWAEILTDPMHSEILEWALYMGTNNTVQLTAANALREIKTKRKQERKFRVPPFTLISGGDEKWRWTRTDAGGNFGTVASWAEISAVLLTPGNARCARCDVEVDVAQYGPFVAGPFACIYHEFCTRCLFTHDYDYGARRLEAANVRTLPLVGTQRFTTGCYGCAKKSKFWVPKDP